MRTIPENMLAYFQEQQGLEIKFIVEIKWDGVTPIMYSTCEFADLEVYAYVKEFNSFQSASHVEGLGSVSSINIVFHDQFGHFREQLETVDFMNYATAIVYLTIDGTEMFDLFEGKITDGASWQNNEFTIEILSNTIEKEIGYQPSIDDVDELDPNYDFLTRHLNTSGTWPSIFGTVKNYEVPIIWSQRVANVEEDLDYTVGVDPYEIVIDSHDDFTLDSEYLVNIVGKGNSIFSIIGTGVFTTNEASQPVFMLDRTGVTSNWYANIPFTIKDNDGFSGETDSPTTRIEIAPGSFTLGAVPTHTLGPDGEEIESAFIQFMKLEINYTLVVGATTAVISKYYNCIRQEGNICTLNEILSIPDYATLIYIKTVSKANDIIYKIPASSKIFILGDQVAYAIDTKHSTTLDRLALKQGKEIITLDPSVYTVSTTALWVGSHPDVKYVHMDAEVYMRFIEHYALEGNSNEGLLATAHNTYDTEAEAIEQMSGITTTDAIPATVNFAYLAVEDAENIIPEIAWQSNKAVRYTRVSNADVIQLIDLTDVSADSVFEFNDHNVQQNSVRYGFTSKDDLYTVFRADFQTNNYLKDLQTIRMKSNVDKYGEIVLDVDYYIFTSKATAETKLAWWKDKLSSFHYIVNLTGFMDAFGLEVWDRVYVNLDPSQFYDPDLGTPFEYVHDGVVISPWVGYGRIKEISPDLETGLIEFTIEIEDF